MKATDENVVVPAMPCSTTLNCEHRPKMTSGLNFSNLAMVTSPVGRKELYENPKALEAFAKEWKGLHDQGVFDFSTVREHDDLKAKARDIRGKKYI